MSSTSVSYVERLALRAAEAPEALAIIETGGRRVTRGALVGRVREVAAGLTAAGMQPGDQALFSVRPGIDALVLILAIHDAGGVIVPIDPSMGKELFAARVALLAPKWVMAESLLLASSAPWLSLLLRLRGVRLVPLGRLRGVQFVRVGRALPGAPRALTIAGLAARGDGRGRELTRAADRDDAFIVFTSGTTGMPKGVVHTRASLDAILESVGRELRTSAGDVFYTRELHLILPALFAGAAVVIPRRLGFSGAGTLSDLERYGVTHMFAVTRDCQLLVDHCTEQERRLPTELRMLLIGGAPVPVAFLRRLSERVSASTEVWCIYGMTEMLPIARVSLRAKLDWTGEGDYVGSTVPGVEVRSGPDGELIVSGPGLFSRYLGGPPVIEHSTGDLARIGADGISLLGRAKDMIIRGEFNIYPALYEPAFERVPGVRRSAMIGLHDDGTSDERDIKIVEPAAGIDPRQLERDVADALRRGNVGIDAFAHPDHILALALPESGRSSKIDKAALRRVVRERLG